MSAMPNAFSLGANVDESGLICSWTRVLKTANIRREPVEQSCTIPIPIRTTRDVISGISVLSVALLQEMLYTATNRV